MAYMSFYFFMLIQVFGCLYYFEGRWALMLGYGSWLSTYDFLGVDMVNGPLWDRYGATYYGFVQVAIGESIDIANGLEAFLNLLTLLSLALVFTAYIFGIIIDRIVQLNEKKRMQQDLQDKIVEFCELLGLPDKVERKIVAKFLQMSEADVPVVCEKVGDLMRQLSRDLNNEIALTMVHSMHEAYQERRKQDQEEIESFIGETSWGLKKSHLKAPHAGNALVMPPEFPFTHYMFTLLRKLSFHPERYSQMMVHLMRKMDREFYVSGSKVYYFKVIQVPRFGIGLFIYPFLLSTGAL